MSLLASVFDRFTRLAAVLLLGALLGCVVIGVVTRAFNQPVTWSEEMAQHLLVWTGFVGWVLATRRRAHIRITMFIDRLPRALRTGLEVLIQSAVVVLAACLLWYGTPLIGRNWDIEWVSLPLPAGLLYLPIPFAAAALAGQALVEIAEALAGRTPPPEPSEVQPL